MSNDVLANLEITEAGLLAELEKVNKSLEVVRQRKAAIQQAGEQQPMDDLKNLYDLSMRGAARIAPDAPVHPYNIDPGINRQVDGNVDPGIFSAQEQLGVARQEQADQLLGPQMYARENPEALKFDMRRNAIKKQVPSLRNMLPEPQTSLRPEQLEAYERSRQAEYDRYLRSLVDGINEFAAQGEKPI